jgi:fanconi-associated nuclease 1
VIEEAEARFAAIERGEGPALMEETYRHHDGTLCAGLHWRAYPLDDLRAIALGLGPRVLAAVCRLLAGDYGLWRHGLPVSVMGCRRCRRMVSPVERPTVM